MRQAFFLFMCCLFLNSCTQWETKKIGSEEYLAQEWKTIDINEVDVFPSFDSCDEFTEKNQLRSCFENEITSSFYSQLEKQILIVNSPIEDTVWLDLIIDEKGKLCIDSLHINQNIRVEIPSLQRHIQDAALHVPTSYPATKQGIPVKTSFKLPIVLKVD